jgi:naphtho-gamma-pyrone polyketide synthase
MDLAASNSAPAKVPDKASTSDSMASTDIVPVIGAVICQELGIETDEIEVDTDLRQSGLNSLTALMITVRLHEEYGIDLAPGILKENYSLCKLRKALHRKIMDVKAPKDDIPDAETPPPVDNASSIADPPSSSETNRSTLTSSPPPVPPTPEIHLSPPKSITTQVMAIIAEEMNIDEAEFADSVEWANLGLDSIMSLSICGRLREELEMEVESTVFSEYDSVGAFRKHFDELHTFS